jgi:NADH-quinone oxidoreductase subunit M
MLWMFQRVYLGTVTREENTSLRDLTPREAVSVIPLCAMAILMGVLPAIFLSPMAPAVERLVSDVEQARQNNEIQDSQLKGQNYAKF